MERHEIEVFLALAEELHFGEAGRRLGITTTRVSQVVRVLERRVGVRLFDRTSRRVTLTPTGRQLYEDLKPAYDGVREAVARAVAHGRGLTGTLRVGYVGAAAGQLVMNAAIRFRRGHPDCAVEAREVQSGGAVERLHTDQIDVLVGCLPLDGPGLTVGPVLLTEQRMLAVPAGHPFARAANLSIKDLGRVHLIAAPCSLPTRPADGDAPTAETFQEVLTLVGAGQGAFVVGEHVTRFYARPDVVYVPLRDAPPLCWGPVWPTGRETAKVRAFTAAADRSSRAA
ncbi:LysR family transcriptional regulator [Actinoplanes lobatus]|uniref:DNA-binding transcriptional LysR family regulator n=1 Tax=Actinoplanes lobatus TaxID=113568 RepID=A0A7W7HJY6_9ACTN|nr:LysR family transcriptional regulator [Actinoplanes lobatus]MBB4751884.1 DNA-binding transcriptional LysR family regulator [Actinoplanes lobatus]GGN99209.1 LysR family transcriptional regulator [Actinoplanes lobatus]GIE46316.1 LysR family transcriptional regulator [Actinoplanes lobatus]